MADDVEVLESMCAWSHAEARVFFESGGALPPADPDVWERWFPHWVRPVDPPRLRLVCCHPAGSSVTRELNPHNNTAQDCPGGLTSSESPS